MKCTQVVHFAFRGSGVFPSFGVFAAVSAFFVRMKALCNPIRVECGLGSCAVPETAEKHAAGRARWRNIVSSVHQLAGTVVYL